MTVVTNRYQKTLNATDFGLTADVSLAGGKWTLVCEYVVPAQQEIAVGATEVIQGGATGRPAYIRFDDTSGQLTGKIRIVVADANDQGQVVTEHSTAEWSASETDRNSALLLHEDLRRAQQDSKIQIWMYVAADKTIDYDDADVKISLPVTVYTVRR